ncbi:MAG: helix-turn-helix domain-containing protein [Thermomicrobiales bacterium]
MKQSSQAVFERLGSVEIDVEAKTAERTPDDIETYIASLTEHERRDIDDAGTAIDIAIFLHRARERRGLSQSAAAKLAGLHQQTVSRFEQPDANPRLDSVQSYLRSLGFSLRLHAVEMPGTDQPEPFSEAGGRDSGRQSSATGSGRRG